MNGFLSGIQTEFHWDERYIIASYSGFTFKIREDLFDDYLEMENIKSGKKVSLKSIYQLVD